MQASDQARALEPGGLAGGAGARLTSAARRGRTRRGRRRPAAAGCCGGGQRGRGVIFNLAGYSTWHCWLLAGRGCRQGGPTAGPTSLSSYHIHITKQHDKNSHTAPSLLVTFVIHVLGLGRAWPNLKYMLVETCPFTHQAYIALTCNKGGRFSARYVLKAQSTRSRTHKSSTALSALSRGTLLCLAGMGCSRSVALGRPTA